MRAITGHSMSSTLGLLACSSLGSPMCFKLRPPHDAFEFYVWPPMGSMLKPIGASLRLAMCSVLGRYLGCFRWPPLCSVLL